MSAPPAAILLDIEGTTTPIAYVYDVLFPYARRELPAYVEAHFDDAHVSEAAARLRAEWEQDAARGERPPVWRDDDRASRVASIVSYALWLMDRDSKASGLKMLQAHITRGGYENGSLRGEVYPDVPVAFARWRAAGISVAIFSSGSVPAQQNLFRTALDGDLTPWISRYFDTLVGPKRSPDSYRRIAFALDREPEQLLFISDVAAELDAAREAGFDTRLCVRGGSASEPSGHAIISDFNDV